MSERIARLTKDFHYLEIAKTVSKRSTCINKQFGAVIVQHDRIVATGYNGSPMKCINCSDVGRCRRLEDPNYQRGVTSYDTTCLHKDTVIKLLDGTYKTIEELANSKKRSFWVYSVNTETKEIVPAKAKNARATKKVDKLLKITLDNNESFQCTPDHKILLRDCTYKEAKDLNIYDSLMPMYYSFENSDHEYIRNMGRDKKGGTNKQPTHVLVYKYHNGPIPKGYDIHHSNFKKHDNRPKNLIALSHSEHAAIHAKRNSDNGIAFGGKEAMFRGLQVTLKRLEDDEEFRAMHSERSRKAMINNWNNPDWVAHVRKSSAKNAKKLAAKYNSDPEIIFKRRWTTLVKGVSLILALMAEAGDTRILTDDNYTEIRDYYQPKGKSSPKIPKLSTIYKYADSLNDVIADAKLYNHKVIKIEEIEYNDYVYDITVPNYHNFAIDLGDNSCIFVHNCPAVHAEINAMLSVSRDQMLGATMYLYGWDMINKQVVPNVNSCPGCRRAILNSGITKLVVADTESGLVSNDPDIPYRVRIINVDDWRNDEAALFSGY